jgi:uncharacterized protein DUF6461
MDDRPATPADYRWFGDHWLREAFCITLVRGLDEAEALRRFGGERGRPRPLTVVDAWRLSLSLSARYPRLVLAARRGGWVVAVEANGWEGARPEVLRALSAGTAAVSVYRNVNALGYFSDAADGELRVQFELLFPQRRWGSRPDLLVAPMRAMGLDPDRDAPLDQDMAVAALALAERVTGVRVDRQLLDGPLTGVEIAPLLDDPPASFFLDAEDVELAAAVDRAAPDQRRRAAAAAARQAVRLAGLDRDPVVAEALAAAAAGQARPVGDHAPLGRRIRAWAVEADVADQLRNDPAAPLHAQLRDNHLRRLVGEPERPLVDPSPWQGRAGLALLLRWRAGQAARAALFPDSRTAVWATLETLRHLPGDPWPAIRAAALAALRTGGPAGPSAPAGG